MHPQAPITMLMAPKDRRPDRPRGHDGRQGAEWWGPLLAWKETHAVNGGGQQRRTVFELPLLTLNEFQSVSGPWTQVSGEQPRIVHQNGTFHTRAGGTPSPLLVIALPTSP